MPLSFHLFSDEITDAEREEARNQYFADHEFTKRKIDDLRRVVDRALLLKAIPPDYPAADAPVPARGAGLVVDRASP